MFKHVECSSQGYGGRKKQQRSCNTTTVLCSSFPPDHTSQRTRVISSKQQLFACTGVYFNVIYSSHWFVCSSEPGSESRTPLAHASHYYRVQGSALGQLFNCRRNCVYSREALSTRYFFLHGLYYVKTRVVP